MYLEHTYSSLRDYKSSETAVSMSRGRHDRNAMTRPEATARQRKIRERVASSGRNEECDKERAFFQAPVPHLPVAMLLPLPGDRA
jgi:hypothetical protein